MKLLKKKSVGDVAEAFKQQYEKARSNFDYWNGVRFSNCKFTGKEMYSQILECKDTAEIKERVPLLEGWNMYYCDLCGGTSYTIIDTEHKDDEGNNMLVCHACILEMNTAWKEWHL